MDFVIDKFPVLIISPPRCGSTALLEKIGVDYNLVQFSEPNLFPGQLALLKFHLKKRKDFAVKLMVNAMSNNRSNGLTFLKSIDFFVITLSRKNVINQCISHYIAVKTGIWNRKQIKEEDLEIYIDLDPDLIVTTVNFVKTVNNKLFEITNSNLHLYYEDLNLSGLSIVKNPTPINIQEIRNKVIEIYGNIG